MKHLRTGLSALAIAVFLAGCGGGGADTTSKVEIKSVKVFGDSLADVGTTGMKFTVQPGANQKPSDVKVFSEVVASKFGVDLCPALKATAAGLAPNPGCTAYAVAGSRIDGTAGVPVPKQMAMAAQAGPYTASDLVLIDGGGNDASALITAFLGAGADKAVAFNTLLTATGLITPQAVQAAYQQGGSAAMGTLGGLYMQELAKRFYGQIDTYVLKNGATNVAVLNMPPVTLTPKLKAGLARVAAATNQTTADTYAAMFDKWVQAFNDTLKASIAGNSSIVLVDFYDSFKQQVADKERYGITNVETPVCAPVNTTQTELEYFKACTPEALAQRPEAATGGANWWEHYGFADSFHPTPYAHQLLGTRVLLDLGNSGRL